MIKYCNKIINDLHIGVKNNKIANKNIKNKSKSTNQKKKEFNKQNILIESSSTNKVQYNNFICINSMFN